MHCRTIRRPRQTSPSTRAASSSSLPARLADETAKAAGEPLLSAGDWLALRAICSG